MRNMNRKMRTTLKLVVLYSLSAIVLVWALSPVFWIVISSISTRTELLSRPYKHWIPHRPTLQNFIDVVTVGQRYRAGGILPTAMLLLSGLRNTLIISLSTAFLITSMATVVGYCFARLNFRGKNFLFFFIMLMMPLPIWVSIVSLYYLLAHIGLIDTNLGLILILSTLSIPLAVWLMITFVRDTPRELEEAALMDGATRWQMIRRVVVPITMPGITSVFLVTFLNTWNSFLIPLIFTNTARSQTITVVLSLFVGQYEVAWEQMAAATVLIMIPPIVLALFFQKYLIRGLTLGAVKG